MLIYNNYINNCKNLKKKFNYLKRVNFPYLTIILISFNMENYIERALLSILNQTFKNYEILIINDSINDDIGKIVNKMNIEPNVIKIINHTENLGIYISRVDGILNSHGKYILFLDSDDSYLNPFLFQKLYNYNLNNNLDIIEFGVFYEEEGKSKIFIPKEHFLSHFHNYSHKIIHQPKLSNILFFKPRTNNYTNIICRPIWNKMVKKEIQQIYLYFPFV